MNLPFLTLIKPFLPAGFVLRKLTSGAEPLTMPSHGITKENQDESGPEI
jgi:hypothetical protein